MRLQLFGTSSIAESVDLSNQRTVNMYYDTPDVSGVRSPAYLVHTPGLKSMMQIADSVVRGQITVNDRHFAVIGNGFYELTYNIVSDTISYSSKGTLSTTTGIVSMAYNLSQIVIVDGTSAAKVYNYETDAFASITDPDFLAADYVVFMDTYFIFLAVDSANIFASAINDGTDFDALDIATAQKNPDLAKALAVINNELWVFGDQSIEIWSNTAEETGFPFTPRSNAAMTTGCAAKWSVAQVRDIALWMADTREICTSTGYGDFKIVSTKEQHRIFQNYARVDDALAFTYNEDGHWFYVITFPSANATWAYDVRLEAWHEREYTNSSTGLSGRSRINNIAMVGGKIFGGDHTNGKIYRIGRDLYDDDGETKHRYRISGNMNVENRFIGINRLSISISTQVGTPAQYPDETASSDDSPKLILQYSKDNGRTWSSELWRDVGAYNQFYGSCDYFRLGTSKNWTFKIQYVAKTPIAFIDAFADVVMDSSFVQSSLPGS